MNHERQLEEEVKTWCIEDPVKRAEKFQRERIRHAKLIRDLLLDQLNTQVMDIMEIGGGPEPVSDLLPFGSRVVIDPCTNEYRKYYSCPDHVNVKAEDYVTAFRFHLIIATNSLDHVDNVHKTIAKAVARLRPGGYFAIMCAENNALTNPHPCHVHNLTAHRIHEYLDRDFETVWELTYAQHGYRYGWVEYEGRRGQPAFALLMRKCVGYGD